MDCAVQERRWSPLNEYRYVNSEELNMWMFFGIGAIIFALLGIVWTVQNKKATWFRFFSLSFTAFTVCAFYSDGASMVVNEEWSGLMDIMPTVSKALWVCTIASILISSVSLLRESKMKRAINRKDKFASQEDT